MSALQERKPYSWGAVTALLVQTASREGALAALRTVEGCRLAEDTGGLAGIAGAGLVEN